ncbi:pheromone A receptor-domain-containing protein [Mycena sp. CBHHK59/15]|nr:pheromone A receptor-domain-containing protein [Mycena sp. CBHHK59/15]
MHPELALGAFLASALVLVPLPWHWRARNIATLSIIVWLFVSNLTYAINSIIWSGSVDEVVPVWCDIVTKLEVGATAALPACCLSLALQLWRVASTARTTHKINILILDLILCWGYPVITMILHYVVQGHRFDIIEDFGCRPTTYVSVPAILLFYAPITVVVVLTFIYSGLAFAAFHQRRRNFTSFLVTTNSSFTKRRYLRLMAITTVLAVWDAIVIAVVFAITFRSGLLPYTSWADVHSDFARADKYPTVFIPPDLLLWTYVSWWTIPLSGFSFFCFFSFGEDAVAEYGPWFRWVARGVTPLARVVSRIVSRRRVRGRNTFSPASSTASEAHLSLPRWTDDRVIDIKADFADTSSDCSYEPKADDRDSYDPTTREALTTPST